MRHPPLPKENTVPEVHVYEPALCCTTGVCGPDLDQRLVTFTADAAHVNQAGGTVVRHNLANDPHAFVSHEQVRTFMHLVGSEGLPLTTVDGVTVLTGSYPTRDQLIRFAADDGSAGDTASAPDGPGGRSPLSLIPISDGASACAPGFGGGCC